MFFNPVMGLPHSSEFSKLIDDDDEPVFDLPAAASVAIANP
ncbi:MAG: hypothetical protein AAF501_21245 [Pseudomonadota bacterium]